VKSSEYDYQTAEKVTIEAVSVLGEEYQKELKKGLTQERWVDIYENKGKRSGAYSSGCYDTRPFILMNYNGSLNDVFTLTHECGHSMHSLLSRKHQPYHNSDYSIFVAEVASTFNEDNLRDYLLKNSKSDDEKIYLINSAIEDIRTTLFRQVMFAEFELKIHELVEAKTPLTPKLLKEVYHELNRFYFGEDIIIDSEIDIEWARVPHFYYNFYVYQYATGIAAAVYLADKVRNGGEKEREAYLNFLKGGSSKYPLDMLKVAGVDMTKSDAIDKTMEVFTNLIDEFEKLTSK
jgi:oligoendopeptidase F